MKKFLSFLSITYFLINTVQAQSSGCSNTGKILWEQWRNIPGSISTIPLGNVPDSVLYLSTIDAPKNIGDNYGVRIKGYLCAPLTGTYTFWLSSDDNSELYINGDKICTVNGFTNLYEWEKYTTQKGVRGFEAGGVYEIVVLFKEFSGTDHVEVGWQLPNGVMERPISGGRFYPANQLPRTQITNLTPGQLFPSGAIVAINANAIDNDGTISKVEFYQGNVKIGEDITAPYNFNWNAPNGNYSISTKAYDNNNASRISNAINISIGSSGPTCTSSGSLLREEWPSKYGEVSLIPITTEPQTVSYITLFEGPVNTGRTNYGDRIRGYICPPETGNYTFWIAGNDEAELWLSSDSDPANKKKIAFVPYSYADSRQWDKYPQQKSIPIQLIQGKTYYIESLHAQNAGKDNVAVGWQLPNGSFERPISSNRISPFGVSNVNIPPSVNITFPINNQTFQALANISITANSSDIDGSTTKVEFFNGTTKIGEDLTVPYSFDWNFVPVGNYSITAKATDNNGATGVSSPIAVSVQASGDCVTGGITREFYANIPGIDISSIPLTQAPTSISQLNIFEGPTNVGDNFGVRIRGYICPPTTGYYFFNIACNDNGELWFSTDDNPSNKKKIAYVNGFTNSREWEKYPSQRSEWFYLYQGRKYYIEALQKEGVNSDNIAVGWYMPNSTYERPIPGSRLVPYQLSSNASPEISIVSPVSNQVFQPNQNIIIKANAYDLDGTITKVEFYNGTNKLFDDFAAPYEYKWLSVPDGNYTLTAKVYDNNSADKTSSPVSISVTPITTCTAAGYITREFWTGVAGMAVNQIPVHTPSNGTGQLTSFEGPVNWADNYGTRIRGYICPPTTGNYIFWIATNDNGELWLSTDDNPANKVKIAYINSYCDYREWDKMTSQKSATIRLEAGRRYYIEALQKEEFRSDHISVGWQLPNATLERPIAGKWLSPFETTSAKLTSDEIKTTDVKSVNVIAYPNPTESGMLTVAIEGYNEKEKIEIQIKDLEGKTVYTEYVTCIKTCSRTLFNLAEKFKPGAYVLYVVLKDKNHTEKIIIK